MERKAQENPRTLHGNPGKPGWPRQRGGERYPGPVLGCHSCSHTPSHIIPGDPRLPGILSPTHSSSYANTLLFLLLSAPALLRHLPATNPSHRPPKEDKAMPEEQSPHPPAPTLVGCILMASDWIGCAFNSLLGHQKEEGRKESLIHQTEILIEFQPAGVVDKGQGRAKEGMHGIGAPV